MHAELRALYRRYLRLALRMPDAHRAALVCFRARDEFARARRLDGEALQERLLELDVVADQLEHQAAHLSALHADPSRLVIPVDIRPPAAAAETRPRRRLLTALAARTSSAGRQNRFMQGSEPSWMRKKRGGGASDSS